MRRIFLAALAAALTRSAAVDDDAIACAGGACEAAVHGDSMLQTKALANRINSDPEVDPEVEEPLSGGASEHDLSESPRLADDIRQILLDAFQGHGFACNRRYSNVDLDDKVMEQVIEGTEFTVTGKATDAEGKTGEFKALLVIDGRPHDMEVPSAFNIIPPALEDRIIFHGFSTGSPCGDIGISDSTRGVGPTSASFLRITIPRSRKKVYAMGYVPPPAEYVLRHERRHVLTQKQIADIPEAFDWQDKIPKSKAMIVGEQGLCGSCWAWATSMALSDRFYIKTDGKTNIFLSTQHMICEWNKDVPNRGCDGGSFAFNLLNKREDGRAWPFTRIDSRGDKRQVNMGGGDDADEGLVDQDCTGYHATVTPLEERCSINDACSRYSMVQGTALKIQRHIPSIQHELSEFGPTFAAFDVFDDFFGYTKGVYTVQSSIWEGGHAVKLIGWGVDAGVDYWRLQNSWGKDWGEKGFFRIRRGTNEARIESSIWAATPDVSALCENECVHGHMEAGCSCRCAPDWRGDECDQCARECSGPGITGRDDESCTCECEHGHFGPLCTLKLSLSAESLPSNSELEFSFEKISDGGLDLDPMSRLIAYPEGVEPFTEEGGWGTSAITPTPFNPENKNSGSAKFVISVERPTTLVFYIMKHLGLNEFGEDKGFSRELLTVGSVSVTCPDEGCSGKADTCKDAEWKDPITGMTVGSVCPLVKMYGYCNRRAQIYFSSQTIVHSDEICLKTCNKCK